MQEFPWATFCAVVLTVIAAVTGAVVLLWGNAPGFTFEDYLKAMAGFAAAMGVLGIGRGIRSAAKIKSGQQ